MGAIINVYKVLSGKPERIDHAENISVDGCIILKCTFVGNNLGRCGLA
jgi:hypothetical protein